MKQVEKLNSAIPCILDHVPIGMVLDPLPGDQSPTPTTGRRLIAERLLELSETLTPDQVEEVAEAFREAGLL